MQCRVLRVFTAPLAASPHRMRAKFFTGTRPAALRRISARARLAWQKPVRAFVDNGLCAAYARRNQLHEEGSSVAAALVKIGFLWLAVWCCASQPANAQSICASCEVQIGVGGTYHYWAKTGSLILPVLVTWKDDRYEFGVFRFTTQQLLPFPGTRRQRNVANPYWGTSLSRRWRLFGRGPVQAYFGFGLVGKTESDDLSATRWDFASQLGLRFRLLHDRAAADLTIRHWSNGGIRLPNHGQDFATLTIGVNSGPFGIAKAQ